MHLTKSGLGWRSASLWVFLAHLALTNSVIDLYYKSDLMVILNAENFEEDFLNKPHAWLIEFYNSWCGHCQAFVPTWKKLAADVEGKGREGGFSGESELWQTWCIF